MSDWKTVPLASLVENLDSRRVPVKQSERQIGSYPYYGASGIVDWVGGYLFDGEHLLVAEDGENLNSRNLPIAFRATGKFWVNNHAHILKGPPHLLRFLEHYLNNLDVAGWVTGSAQPKLTQGNLNSIPINLPTDLNELEAIAKILAALDDKIELNRRTNQSLEELALALFRSWFVDFDPVVAKAAGRKPAHIRPEIASLFPAKFQDSELGLIPQGWRARSVTEVVEFNPVRRLAKGQPAPYLDMKNVPTNSALPEDWAIRPHGSGMKFQNGDTLLARITPCLENGKTAFVNALADGEVGWGSTEYIVIQPIPPLPAEYGYLLARSDDFRAHAISNMTGSSGRQRVPVNCFDKYLVTEPPSEIAGAFGKIVAPFMRMMKANVEESRTLVALRDTLLPKLLSGELRVKQAEKLVEVKL